MKSAVLGIAGLIAGCGGSPPPAANSDDAPPPAANSDDAPASADVLAVAPFVLTIRGTRSDGSSQVSVLRGDADGLITGEKNGETRELVRVGSDGTFTPLRGARSEIVQLAADGTLSVAGRPLTARVGNDGTVFRGDEPILEIEGGKVVPLIDGLLDARVTVNGEEVSKSTFEITVEGGNRIRRLVAAILIMQMSARGGSLESGQEAP